MQPSGLPRLSAQLGINRTPGGTPSLSTVLNPRTGAYTITGADLGKIIQWSGGANTITLTNGAALGPNFFFGIQNNNDGTTVTSVLTIAAGGSDTIDDLASIKVYPGETFWLYGSGSSTTAFRSHGRIRKGRVQIANVTATAQTNIDIAAPSDSELIDLVYDVTNLRVASNTPINPVIQLHVGGSYQTSGYFSHDAALASNATTYAAVNSSDGFRISGGNNVTLEQGTLTIRIPNFGLSTYPITLIGDGVLISSDGNPPQNASLARVVMFGGVYATIGAFAAIRFTDLNANANILSVDSVRVYGVRK